MKKESILRTMIGITQNDMAMLLNVGRSQFSMFESGKRSLPLPAKELLAEMLQYLIKTDGNAKSHISSEQQQTIMQQQVEILLQENQRQQYLVAKRIAAASKKYDAQLKMLQLADFFKNHKAKKEVLHVGIIHSFTSKANKSGGTEILKILVQHQIKQELLVQEYEFLQSKLLQS